jgi:hypothetical protein
MKKLVIAVDFDGTCVTHDYPEIGQDIGAIPVLKALVENGHRLILYTMRSGETLLQAEAWLKRQGVELWGINENPEQHTWTNSRKVYAHLYIDDAAFGAPLISKQGHSRPFISWSKIRRDFIADGIIKG